MARSRQAGFTLVELLIALTLLAFLSVAVFAGLRFGARSWDAVNSASARQEAVTRTQNFLRARIGAVSVAGPPGQVGLAPLQQIAGASDRMAFAGPWLADLGQGGLYTFTLWHNPTEDGALMFGWKPSNEALARDAALTGERALLRNVTRLRISYFMEGEAGAAGRWVDQWRENASAPSLIRIDVTRQDAAEPWPDLVIAARREAVSRLY